MVLIILKIRKMQDSRHEPLRKRVPKKKSNRIPDATLGVKVDPEARFESVEDQGQVNAPPIIFTKEEYHEFHRQEDEKDKQRLENSTKTETYGNGRNVWRLISKTYNDFLGWEHVTTAMAVEHGVLVCVKEAIGQKSDSTVCFIPGSKLEMRPSVDEFGEPSYDQDGKLIQKWAIL